MSLEEYLPVGNSPCMSEGEFSNLRYTELLSTVSFVVPGPEYRCSCTVLGADLHVVYKCVVSPISLHHT